MESFVYNESVGQSCLGLENTESNVSFHNYIYRYEVDPSTGTLMIIEDSREISGSNISSGEDCIDNYSCLKVLESGEVVLVTSLSNDPNSAGIDSSDSITNAASSLGLKAVPPQQSSNQSGVLKGNENGGDDLERSSNFGEDTNEPPVSTSANVGRLPKANRWSDEKVDNLLRCISKRGRQMIKSSKIKTKMKVWNDISREMHQLGHTNCDKDECSKKWSNLYRTWRQNKCRPKSLRIHWPFFDEVSNVLRILSGKPPKGGPTKKKVPAKKVKPQNSEDLLKRLMKETRARQEALEKTEEIFQMKMKQLDEERDEILADIKKTLGKTTNLKFGKMLRRQTNDSDFINKLNNVIAIIDPSQPSNEPVFYLEIPPGSSGNDIVALINASCNNNTNNNNTL